MQEPITPAQEPQSAPLVGHTEQPPIDPTTPIEQLQQAAKEHEVLLTKKLHDLHDYLEKELAEVKELQSDLARDWASHFDNWLGSVKRTIARRK